MKQHQQINTVNAAKVKLATEQMLNKAAPGAVKQLKKRTSDPQRIHYTIGF